MRKPQRRRRPPPQPQPSTAQPPGLQSVAKKNSFNHGSRLHGALAAVLAALVAAAFPGRPRDLAAAAICILLIYVVIVQVHSFWHRIVQLCRLPRGETFLLAGLALAATAVIWLPRESSDAPPTKPIRVILADFWGPDGSTTDQYHITQRIYEALHRARDHYEDISIHRLSAKERVRDHSHAHDIADKHSAALVFWGDYSRSSSHVSVTIHAHLQRKPGGFSLSNDYTTVTPQIKELETFQIHAELESATSFLTLLIAGLYKFEAGRYEEALTRFDSALSHRSRFNDFVDFSLVHYFKGDAYLQMGNPALAARSMSAAITLNPLREDSYIGRSVAFDRLGEYEAALADANRALTLKPGRSDLFGLRAIINEHRGRYDEAIRDWDQALRLKPNDPMAILARALNRYNAHHYEEALKDLDKAVSADTSLYPAYMIRSLVYQELGDYEKAAADISVGFRLRPRAFESYYGRGKLHIAQRKAVSALDDFEVAITINPQASIAHDGRGVALASLGRMNEALMSFDKALSTDSSNASAYFHRAMAHFESFNLKMAERDLSECLRLVPAHFHCLVYSGDALVHRGEPEKAILQYDNAIARNPDHPWRWAAYNSRAFARRGLKQWDLSLQDANQAIGLHPDADTYTTRAVTYTGMGLHELAIQDFDSAIRHAPSEGALYLNRAFAHERLKLYDQAESDWRRSIDLEPNGPVRKARQESMNQFKARNVGKR